MFEQRTETTETFWEGLTFWEKVDSYIETAANVAVVLAALRYFGVI